MKRILSLCICILMFLSCTHGSFADYEKDNRLSFLFTPSVFTKAMNEQIDFIVNALYSAEDYETKKTFISYLQLKLSEGDDTFLWYDNEDWLVELSAYFDNNRANTQSSAHSITISFPVGDEYSHIYNTIGVTVSSLLSSVEKELDFYKFSEYIDSCLYNYMETGREAYESLKFQGYQIVVMLYNQYELNRCAIALIRDNA